MLLALFTGVVNAQVQERFKTKKGKETAPVEKEEAEKKKADWVDNILVGGNFSLNFSNTNTYIYLAPQVGYKFSDEFIAGVGFNYQYAKLRQAYDLNTGRMVKIDGVDNQVYGPKVFANYFVFEGVYLGVQGEVLNHDVYYYNPTTGRPYSNNEWTPVLFLEVGYSQEMGSKGVIQVGIRYNVLDDFDSPYSTAFYPVIGIMF